MSYKLPQGWVECEFEQCIDKINPQNKVKIKEYLEDGLYPVIDQGQKLIGGYCNNINFVITNISPIIIFGDHTRCFKYIDFDFIAGADGVKILKPHSYFNAKLFYYFCQIIKFPNKGYSRHYQYLAKSTMKVPPLNEQKRIVEKIECEFEKIDTGLEHLNQVKEQIKQYKQSVLKSAFDGKLYKTTEWECKKLEEITLKIGDVDHKMPKEVDIGIPYISPKDFYGENEINFNNAKKISCDAYKALSQKILPEKNDIIFPRYGTIGVLRYIDTDAQFLVSYSCAVIKTSKDKANSKYLYYYLLSPQIKSQIQSSIRQTTQANIGIQSIKDFQVYIGDKNEQQKIVEEIEKRFEVADKIEKTVDENIEKAQQLKQSILKKAFEGRLVPQNPNDEPASVLLEKIKSERKKKQ